MKRNRLVRRRNLIYQTLDARLAFDADSVVSDLQIEDTRAVDLETVDLSVVDGDVSNLEMVAFFSVGQSDVAQDGEVEFQVLELQDIELQDIDLQRSNDFPAEDVDVMMMTLGSIQVDFDTNNDGELAAADALVIINALNSRNLNLLATVADNGTEASKFEMNVEFDINRDGLLSPIDALLVINALNLQSNSDVASIVADESADFAATLPTDLPGEITSDDTTDIAPMLSMMRMAGATEVKIDGVSRFSTIALSFDSEGKVVANAGDEVVEFTVDENNAISIAGKAVPVAFVSLGDSQQFVPYPVEDESIHVTWPWSFDVDSAFAYM